MKAIVTGSFDPITVGHVDLIKKAAKRFDSVYVVALLNTKKSHMFTLDQRKELIALSTQDIDNVIPDAYDGLTADYMHNHGITHIVRCIRTEEDREYEENLAKIMNEIDKNFVTVFLEPDANMQNISSSIVRAIIDEENSVKNYIHPMAVKKLNLFLKENKNTIS